MAALAPRAQPKPQPRATTNPAHRPGLGRSIPRGGAPAIRRPTPFHPACTASDGDKGCPALWRLPFSRHCVTENTMAEFTKGIENLQDAIASCEQASAALATAEAAEAAKAKTDIDATLTSLHEVSGKFFMKTMMSV